MEHEGKEQETGLEKADATERRYNIRQQGREKSGKWRQKVGRHEVEHSIAGQKGAEMRKDPSK